MILATVDETGWPHARTVLLKGFDERGFVFYTNYDSHKGADLDAVPRAASVFFWPELERQIRIEGTVERVSEADSDNYFATRPEGSRLGAWASPQSEVIKDRKLIEQNYNLYKSQFDNQEIPRPPHWGGYRIFPLLIEFWQGRSSRMHDRIVFSKKEEVAGWSKYRLAP
jgi:pyridoxamine 5'-phosphate oxidase